MLRPIDLSDQSAKTLRQPARLRLFSAIPPALHQLREQAGAECIDLGDIVQIERYAAGFGRSRDRINQRLQRGGLSGGPGSLGNDVQSIALHCRL